MPSGKVLIVEDDQDQALALAVHLKDAGYTVVSALDSGAAVSMAAMERPDVILLDLGLPGGSGLTALARLRSQPETVTTPVIVISGSGTDRDWVFAQGAQGYMEKPADPKAVIVKIGSLLHPD